MWPDMEISTTSTERPLALIGTPTAGNMTSGTPRSAKFRKGRTPDPVELALEGVYRPLISSPGASLASRSATPGSGRARTIFAGSGPSSPESLATYDPATSSWRTSQDSWLDTEGWGQSLATWPPSGMTRNGTASQLAPLVPRTSATASGSWPTPTGRDHKDGQYNPNVPINSLLGRAVWPTPSSGGETGGPHGLVGGSGHRKMLVDLVGEDEARSMGSGSLNPTWVEWLMGFPIGWTDLGHSATRSSRKSSNG